MVLTTALPISQAATAPFQATAKYDATIGKVVVSGTTTTAVGVGSRVSVYDVS
jgi:hypothetical protein